MKILIWTSPPAQHTCRFYFGKTYKYAPPPGTLVGFTLLEARSEIALVGLTEVRLTCVPEGRRQCSAHQYLPPPSERRAEPLN